MLRVGARTRTVLLSALLLALVPLCVPRAALAQEGGGERFALLIQGASGEAQYAKLHRTWLDTLSTVLRDEFGYEPQAVTVIAERAGAGETRATAENVRTEVARLAGTLTPDDQLLIVFIGHGTAQGQEAKFNLLGPDLGVSDWKALLDPVRARIALVDTTSGSFPYLEGLAAPGRVIVTATNSPAQQFHTVFPDAFIRALTSPDTDQDKNGRISLLEAFMEASRLVAQHYQQSDSLLATETAVIDPTGDGTPHMATAEFASNSPAALLYLDAPEVATSDDPELQKLLTRQQALTEQVDSLRLRRESMAEDDYNTQFEALLAELAEVSREVRRRSGG